MSNYEEEEKRDLAYVKSAAITEYLKYKDPAQSPSDVRSKLDGYLAECNTPGEVLAKVKTWTGTQMGGTDGQNAIAMNTVVSRTQTAYNYAATHMRDINDVDGDDDFKEQISSSANTAFLKRQPKLDELNKMTGISTEVRESVKSAIISGNTSSVNDLVTFFTPQPKGTTPPPPPTQPIIPAPGPTQAEQEANYYSAYTKAIDKAIAGDATEMKNLDRFFTGAERPPIGYTPEYLQLERRAGAAGVTIDQQKANETALATSATKLIRGDGPINPDDGAANTGNGAAVFAVNANGERFHITGQAAQEMRDQLTWTEPVVLSQSIVDSMTFGGRIESASQLANINPAAAPVVPVVDAPLVVVAPVPADPLPPVQVTDVNQTDDVVGVAGSTVVAGPPIVIEPGVSSGDAPSTTTPDQSGTTTPQPQETTQSQSESDTQNQEEQDRIAHEAAAAQAREDQEAEATLATATASKSSAKESRLKKLMSMRKPWTSGGGASSSSGTDSMVAPPITPSSQIPPPPL